MQVAHAGLRVYNFESVLCPPCLKSSTKKPSELSAIPTWYATSAFYKASSNLLSSYLRSYLMMIEILPTFLHENDRQWYMMYWYCELRWVPKPKKFFNDRPMLTIPSLPQNLLGIFLFHSFANFRRVAIVNFRADECCAVKIIILTYINESFRSELLTV